MLMNVSRTLGQKVGYFENSSLLTPTLLINALRISIYEIFLVLNKYFKDYYK